jgi:hypothetical protein
MKIYLPSILGEFFENAKNLPLVITDIQNHKINNNWSRSYAKNEINEFFYICRQ